MNFLCVFCDSLQVLYFPKKSSSLKYFSCFQKKAFFPRNNLPVLTGGALSSGGHTTRRFIIITILQITKVKNLQQIKKLPMFF